MEDIYQDFLCEDITFENLKEMSLKQLDKLKDKLTLSCKKKLITEQQNIKLNHLNIELENYDNTHVMVHTKKEQRKLFIRACLKQNSKSLFLLNKNYESLTQSFRDENRNKINAYMTEKLTCECGDQIIRANLSRHKQTKSHFSKLNGDVKSVLTEEEKRKNLNTYMTEKLTCECGDQIIRANLSRHKKTKRHLSMLIMQNN